MTIAVIDISCMEKTLISVKEFPIPEEKIIRQNPSDTFLLPRRVQARNRSMAVAGYGYWWVLRLRIEC